MANEIHKNDIYLHKSHNVHKSNPKHDEICINIKYLPKTVRTVNPMFISDSKIVFYRIT